jgi:Skp family chaperone for outer membrane proteins
MFRRKLSLVIILLLSAVTAFSMMISSTKMAYVNIEKIYKEISQVEKARAELSSLIDEKKSEIEETERAIASVRNKVLNAEATAVSSQMPVSVPVQEQAQEESLDSTSSQAVEVSTGVEEAPAAAVEQKESVEDKNIIEAQPIVDKPVAAPRIPDFEIESFKAILAQKEKELKALMGDHKNYILKKEKEFEYRILGQIYDAVKKIALAKGYNVIVEKEVILYSEESVVDITDDVIRSLNEN